MNESFPFYIYSGLLTKEHRKRIGSALWEFLWCIDKTTKEFRDGDELVGLVLGGKPINLSEISEELGGDKSTIHRNIEKLESGGYLIVVRAPYGLVIKVRQSKKWGIAKTQQQPSNWENNVVKMQPPLQKRNEHCKNANSNKDKAIDLTITTADTDPFETLISNFCEIHAKLDIHVKRNDIILMQWMLDQKIPVELMVKVMSELHRERTAVGTVISTFVYYKQAILEAWEAAKAKTDRVPVPAVALGEDSITGGVPVPVVALGSPRRTKQQQELDDLRRRRAEEERQREQSRGV